MTMRSNLLAATGTGVIAAGALAMSLAFAAVPHSGNAPTQASVIAMGQKAKNDSVSITYAYMPEDGFLVIHSSNSKGQMNPKAIGSISLKEGAHRNVPVKLSQPIKPGEKLWVTLQRNLTSTTFTAFNKPVEQSFKVG